MGFHLKPSEFFKKFHREISGKSWDWRDHIWSKGWIYILLLKIIKRKNEQELKIIRINKYEEKNLWLLDFKL